MTTAGAGGLGAAGGVAGGGAAGSPGAAGAGALGGGDDAGRSSAASEAGTNGAAEASTGGGGGIAGTGNPAVPDGAATGGAGGAGGAPGMDACPDDPVKTQPGVCGCGAPEACAPLKQALVHRYAFGGSGAVAEDSIGTANGTVVGSVLTGSGSVVLNGADQFVDLPNGLISRLQSATFEAWVTVALGIGTYSHLLDFGSSTGAEGSQSSGRSFLFLAPGSNASDVMRVAISLNGSGGESKVDSAFIPVGVLTHVAVVIDDPADTMLLYRDGALKGMVSVTSPLSMIADVNNWLGRSQFASDANFKGSIHEFRVYDVALSSADLKQSAMLGPDPVFLAP
jgi:hypothetical protein